MGSGADARHRHSRQRALQPKILSRKVDGQIRRSPNRVSQRRNGARPRQQFYDLLLMPHLVDADLFRLSSADDSQRQARHVAQRRPHYAQLHQLQLPGAARRHLHAGGGRHGHRTSHRASALLLRGAGQLAKREPRMALLPATDHFRARAFPARPSARSFRTPSAREKPSNAATATFPPPTTTTPGWLSCFCRAPTS